MKSTLKDRYYGCLLGLATGDALGAPVEFQPPGTFKPIKEMQSGGAFNLSKGQWTDDTSMALCIADSLVKKRKFVHTDILDNFLDWYRNGFMSSSTHCFDIGNRTKLSLEDYEKNRKPHRPIGLIDYPSNGSIMRLAPIPMAYRKQIDVAIHLCGESSSLTHNHIECVDSCRYLGSLILGALNGTDKKELLSPFFSPGGNIWNGNPLCEQVSIVAEGFFKVNDPPIIKAEPLAAKSLEAALWAFNKTDNFRDGCLLAANLGDDSDTVAAVYGQLAGAYYGLNSIPGAWLKDLVKKPLLFYYAHAMYLLSETIA